MTAVATAPVPVVQERPILFSGPMVRAILAGRKTQTRRLVRPQPDPQLGETPGPAWNAGFVDVRCPYGKPGDRLWVRERLVERDAWWRYAADDAPVQLHVDDTRALAMVAWAHHKVGDTCSSIHMPRWASRLTLEVTDVRVERLQDISTRDAMAEGIPQTAGEAHVAGLFDMEREPGHEWDNRTSVENFARLWDAINGKRAPWSDNRWVWAITFRRLP